MYQQWSRSFCDGKRRIEDQLRSGKPTEFERDKLLAALQDKDKQTVVGLSEKIPYHHRKKNPIPGLRCEI